MQNADNLKFRASSIGKLMGVKGLGETGYKHLRNVWIKEKYSREKELKNKYVVKGLAIEEDSLTLFSRVTKTFYKKNELFFENEFVKGTPDIITEDTIIDIKSSYDIFTFFNATDEAMNKDYFYQLQVYMWLTGKKKSKLCYCLTDTPPYLIDLEKKKLTYDMPPDTSEYEEACRDLDKSLTFGDIPLSERMNQIEIPYDEKAIEKIKDRITEARKYMNENLFKV